MVSSVKSSFAVVTFGEPHTSDGVFEFSSLKDTKPLQVTPLCVRFREQGEPIAVRNETHDLPPSETDQPTLPTETDHPIPPTEPSK